MQGIKPESETCPVCCSCGNLHVHSYYRRKIIDFISGQTVVHEVSVMRVICDSCCTHNTHAILPDFIIPYCSYSLFFILRVLAEYFCHLHTIEKLCERFSITVKQLYKWISLWNLHKSQWLGVLSDSETTSRSFLFSLMKMEGVSSFLSSFAKHFCFSFMQSHANPHAAVFYRNVSGPDYHFPVTT